jgi:hypothetical protein
MVFQRPQSVSAIFFIHFPNRGFTRPKAPSVGNDSNKSKASSRKCFACSGRIRPLGAPACRGIAQRQPAPVLRSCFRAKDGLAKRDPARRVLRFQQKRAGSDQPSLGSFRLLPHCGIRRDKSARQESALRLPNPSTLNSLARRNLVKAAQPSAILGFASCSVPVK